MQIPENTCKPDMRCALVVKCTCARVMREHWEQKHRLSHFQSIMPWFPEHLFSLNFIYFKASEADTCWFFSIKNQGLSRTKTEIQVLSRPWNRIPKIQGFSSVFKMHTNPIISKFFWNLGKAMLIHTSVTSGKISICVKSVKFVGYFVLIILVAVCNLFDFVLLRSVISFLRSLKFALCCMRCYVILWSTLSIYGLFVVVFLSVGYWFSPISNSKSW